MDSCQFAIQVECLAEIVAAKAYSVVNPQTMFGESADRQQMLLVPELYSLREATTGHVVGEGPL